MFAVIRELFLVMMQPALPVITCCLNRGSASGLLHPCGCARRYGLYQYPQWPARNERQIIPGNYTNFDGRFYTKSLADNTFQPKGSYGKPNSYKVSGNILWTQDGDTKVIRMTGQAGSTSHGTHYFPVCLCVKVLQRSSQLGGDQRCRYGACGKYHQYNRF